MMRIISALCTAGLLLGLTATAPAQPGATVGFRNETKNTVIVQGYSIVRGAPRKGQPVVLTPARIGLDNNVPTGPRFYNVYDANQPSRVLLRDYSVPVTGNDQFFALRQGPNPARVMILPDAP